MGLIHLNGWARHLVLDGDHPLPARTLPPATASDPHGGLTRNDAERGLFNGEKEEVLQVTAPATV